jgi:hypothetical protein
VKTVQPGLLSLKAWAAGSSFSMAHRLSAIPAWWKPSDRPAQHHQQHCALAQVKHQHTQNLKTKTNKNHPFFPPTLCYQFQTLAHRFLSLLRHRYWTFISFFIYRLKYYLKKI